MAYRVYSGPHGTPMFTPLEKDRMPCKQFGSFDEAMDWSRHVSSEGRVVLLIEGDDGTQLWKQDIAAALGYDEGRPMRDGHPGAI